MSAVRILIIEDEPLITEDLRGHLEELGCTVMGHYHNPMGAAVAQRLSDEPDHRTYL
jgi:DNA-binding NarL/FixJ family response regulator